MPVQRTCPVCQSVQQYSIPYQSRTALPVQPVICQSCGLVFINPMYTEAEKEAATSCPRALHRPVRFGRPIQRAHERELAGARRFLQFAGRFLTAGDRVLDIGCGDGALLRTLQEFGAAPTGIDLDPQGAEYLVKTYHIPVVVAPFETCQLAEGQFDAVVATHVIEHFFEPVDAMKKIHRLLKPGGLLVLETPNILRPKVGFHRLFSVPHNYYFSPRTLCLAMRRAGFTPIAVREFYRDSFVVAARHHVVESSQDLAPAPNVSVPPARRDDSWQATLKRIQSHDFRYKASLQFIWRKIPGLKKVIMYRIHRDLAGDELSRWLPEA